MTVSLLFGSIADSIASISVSGVTIKDRDQIVANWEAQPNVLYPNPNDPGWITDFSIQYDTLLQGTNASMTIIYTLHYRFLGTLVGDMATFPTAYSGVVDKLIAIINALIAVPDPYSGRVVMTVGDISIGPKEDPAGNQYHGADFALQIRELQN